MFVWEKVEHGKFSKINFWSLVTLKESNKFKCASYYFMATRLEWMTT